MQSVLPALILLFPVLGAALGFVTAGRLPRALAGLIGCLAVVASFGAAGASFLSLASTLATDASGHHSTLSPLTWIGWEWLHTASLSVPFGLHFDGLAAVMCFVITGVGSLIHLYSVGYMADDEGYAKYFAYLNLFVAAMLVLVLADNMPLLFLGWEGVGMASYLLIGFWYKDPANADAAKKAFIVNRIGDAALLLGMFVLFGYAGTFNLQGLNDFAAGLHLTDLVSETGGMTPLAWGLTAGTLLLFIGCTGKSAQLPLFTWLPDAMAGPTPVSALIHAATMVTAGVYLIARLSGLFAATPCTLTIVAIVGVASAAFAATIAITQNDIKKVLAYSTMSQLGFMFAAVGSGAFFAGVFHLMTHAFFKALLFLGAGSVIHGMSGEQDITKMGGLRAKMPWTAAAFLVGCLAIAGVPPLSGFVSKDEILWFVLSNQSTVHAGSGLLNWVLWLGLAVTAALTAGYMFRLYFLVFEGEARGDADTHDHAHESPPSMLIPLAVLSVLSVFAGIAGWPAMLGGPMPVWWLDLHGWLHSSLGSGEALYTNRFDGHGLGWLSLGLALVGAAVGIGLARQWYARPSEVPGQISQKLGPVYKVVAARYYVDEIYAATFGRALRLGAWILHRVVDEFAIDTAAVGGTAWGVRFLGSVVRQFQNGNVQRYAVMLALGLGVIVYLFVM
jgi:NADH-quinone oxidoreductase subunit L